jgi:hypothetical protein
MNKFNGLLAVLTTLLVSASASAITYTGSFSANSVVPGNGPLTAFYTISTDDTLGVLAANNFTGYTLSILSEYGESHSSGTSAFQALGATATSTALSFNFGGPQNTLVFYNGNDALCFMGNLYTCSGDPSSSSTVVSSDLGDTGILPRSSGVEVIATAEAVPEPASWVMLIAGFGLTGAAMRRRTSVIA